MHLGTVIHQLMLHQKLKVHLKHDGETFSLKNWTFSLGDLRSLFPPNFRALGSVAVEYSYPPANDTPKLKN